MNLQAIDSDLLKVFNPTVDAIDFWESIEGMRVQVGNVKAVSPQEHGDLITVLENAPTNSLHGGVLFEDRINQALIALICFRISCRFSIIVLYLCYGDVARILFYMATRYEAGDKVDLELNDKLNNGSAPFHGKLSVLLEWHEQDPVDEFELNRNNVIQKWQGNRNPFIDHPEWVELIWGEAGSLSLPKAS